MGFEEWCEAYDPPRVGWQTEQLYRIEHARRALRRARDAADFAAAWHNRYEDEARQRAIALRVAQEARREAAAAEAAYLASPEGIAEKERREAADRARNERLHQEDLARRRYRLPVWAEWAAWRASQKWTYTAIGERLGVAGSAVGRALMDYVYLNHPDESEWPGHYPLDGGRRRVWLRRHFKGRSEPPFPGRVIWLDEGLPNLAPRTPEEYRARNEWVYRQYLAGRRLQQIADDLGISRNRVDQICWQQEEIDRHRRDNWLKPKPWRRVENRGRVIDMGGPRGVWLQYRPPADPRLDNMEPVQPSAVRA